MKKILLFAVALFATASVIAQTTQDSKLVRFDVGFGSGISGMVPIGLSYEQGVYGFNDGSFITAGGYFGYAGKTTDYTSFKWKFRVINIAAQANYYVRPFVDKLDLYAGIRLGYAGITSKYKYDDGRPDSKYSYGSPFCYSVQVGANYWFTDMFGVNAEFGYGIAYANVGLAVKF